MSTLRFYSLSQLNPYKSNFCHFCQDQGNLKTCTGCGHRVCIAKNRRASGCIKPETIVADEPLLCIRCTPKGEEVKVSPQLLLFQWEKVLPISKVLVPVIQWPSRSKDSMAGGRHHPQAIRAKKSIARGHSKTSYGGHVLACQSKCILSLCNC